MNLLAELGMENNESNLIIDWDLQPAETFGIFESWGGKERVKSLQERHYYFFIDDWSRPASLFLMERGIKHARILARIIAPQDMIDRAVASQGKAVSLNRSYAIDDALKKWLRENVIEGGDTSRVIPVDHESPEESLVTDLPGPDAPLPGLDRVHLSEGEGRITEEQVKDIISRQNFFDSHHNPAGHFENYLIDDGNGLTVTDKVTGIMWQRQGCDITSIRRAKKYAEKINRQNFGGFDNWRLPGLAEALSLMEPHKNSKDLYLHPCFSMAQPFIFLSETRFPGGYWFCDYREGSVFWASGTNPGGFGRLCRTA